MFYRYGVYDLNNTLQHRSNKHSILRRQYIENTDEIELEGRS